MNLHRYFISFKGNRIIKTSLSLARAEFVLAGFAGTVYKNTEGSCNFQKVTHLVTLFILITATSFQTFQLQPEEEAEAALNQVLVNS